MKHAKWLSLALPFGLLLVGAAWLWHWTAGMQAFTTASYALHAAGPLPHPAPTLSLLDRNGRELSSRAFDGRHVLLAFMYLSCTDVCPVTSATLLQIHRMLEPQVPRNLVVLSVSLDPARDRPLALRSTWTRYGAPRGWEFASLAKPLDAAARERLQKFGVSVYRLPDGTLVHSAQLFLLDPSWEIVQVFDAMTPAETIASAISGYLR